LDAETAWPFRLALPLCAVRNVNGRENGPYGPDTLDHLLTDARWLQVRTRAVAAATVAAANHSTLSLLATLPAAAEPLPCRLTDQQLVELLKMPTCFGAVRQVVLKHLGNRYRHAFANHWAFVRFAQERGLNLDFTTPPKRPQPGPLPPLPEEP
jgi:hypothetical protein